MQSLQLQPKVTRPKSMVSRYLRLHPLDTRVYKPKDSDFWTASVPPPKGMITTICNGNDEIVKLIIKGILVPVIPTDKEYVIQRALGTVDHRTYRLESKIAAKYQFAYDTLMTLSMIENLVDRCDYNIFDDARGLSSDGQPYLEIIPKDGIVVRDYQGNIITDPTNEMYFVEKYSFDDMVQRGIIVL